MEHLRLQFRLETFNTTNTLLPGNPVSVLGNANFGKIVTVNGSRQAQVAMKILF